MIDGIRSGVKKFVSTSAGWRMMSPLRRPGVAILMYHRVAPASDPFPGLDVEFFRRHVAWLSANCELIAPDELQAAARTSPRTRPRVLLTFDDGYRSYHDHVYPVLRDFSAPGLVFLSTAYVDDPGLPFEWDLLWSAASRTRCKSVRLPWPPEKELAVDGAASRRRLYRELREHLKELRQPDRGELTRRALERLQVGPEELKMPRQVLSWDEVRAASALTTWGGHTHTHPLMSQLSPEELELEIRVCQERITAETGCRARFFAYPNGRARDFDEASREGLRRHGFEVAFATEEGLCGRDADWMAVKRLPAPADVTGLAWTVAALTAR